MYPKVDNFYFLCLKRDWLFCPRSILDQLPQDQRQTYRLLKRIRFILNQVTPDNYELYVEHFRTLEIETREDLQRVAKLMYDKAVDEQGYSDTYARMCAELCDVVIPEGDTGGILDFISFRDYVIHHCQLEMEYRTDSSLPAAKTEDEEADTIEVVKHASEVVKHASEVVKHASEVVKQSSEVVEPATDDVTDIVQGTGDEVNVTAEGENVADDAQRTKDVATDTGEDVINTNSEHVPVTGHDVTGVKDAFSVATIRTITPWEEEDEQTVSRGRALGNAKFVGELFNVGVLSFDIIHRCVRYLLREPDELNFECACKLLETIGRAYRTMHKKAGKDYNQYVVQYLHRMAILVKHLEPDRMSTRMRYKFEDLIDLWRRKWKPRQADLDADDFGDDEMNEDDEDRPIRKVKTPHLWLHV